MNRIQSGFSLANALWPSEFADVVPPQQSVRGLTPSHDPHALCRPEWLYLAKQIKDGVLEPAGKLTPQEITDLAAYLATSPEELDALTVSWQPMGGLLAAHIAQALEVTSRLRSLELSSSNLKASDVACLANVLKINTHRESLDLGGNEIGADGGKFLADMLKVNTSLKQLSIRVCVIGRDGARFMAEMLKMNSGLTSLSLAANAIPAAGLAFLADALKVNRNLTTLELSNNQIEARGVAFLADALKVNRSLTTLDLSHNQIDSNGLALLADALKINPCLTRVNLAFNIVGTAGRIALREALACNKTLRTIVIHNWTPSDRDDTSSAEEVHQAVSDTGKLWACLPLASVRLEMASGQVYPPELMQIILKEMIFSPEVPKHAALNTIIGLHDSVRSFV